MNDGPTVTWEELGSPTRPGTVVVPGIGRVRVTQENIETAAKACGLLKFELTDMTAAQDDGRQYYLGVADHL